MDHFLCIKYYYSYYRPTRRQEESLGLLHSTYQTTLNTITIWILLTYFTSRGKMGQRSNICIVTNNKVTLFVITLALK